MHKQLTRFVLVVVVVVVGILALVTPDLFASNCTKFLSSL
jgi:hypothetical protein